MEAYQTKSPILFLIFNRPHLSRQIFDSIKLAKPTRLYIAADGPRNNRLNEDRLCEETRAIVQQIDWPCEVKTLFRTENLGCKHAVASAINWFFEHEEEGIILEDDCLPGNSFFYFCDTLLEHYRDDTRINHISGCNFQHNKQWGDATYYFSNLTHVWGWASWRRAWTGYDVNLTRYDSHEVRQQFEKIFTNAFVVDSWTEIFETMKAGKIDTWDYQLAFVNMFNNTLSIVPNANLISNIGFGNDATHTTDTTNINARIPLESISHIEHPKYILPEKQADMRTLRKDFNIDSRERKHNSLFNKLKRAFKKQA